MKSDEQLKAYVEANLATGKSFKRIAAEMRSTGWQEQQVLEAMKKYGQNKPWHLKYLIKFKEKLLKYLIQFKEKLFGSKRLIGGAIVFVLLFLVGTYLLFFKSSDATVPKSAPGVSLVEFVDPNFTIQLPDSWTGGAGYKPAATLVWHYSPEEHVESEQAKAANLAVLVDSQIDRIDQQLARLSDSNLQILTDETYSNNSVNYRYVEVVANSLQVPGVLVHVATITAMRGELIINADVTGLDEHWALHAESVEIMLKSLVPACGKIIPAIDEPSSNGVRYFCKL